MIRTNPIPKIDVHKLVSNIDIKSTEECWEWLGGLGTGGYGIIYLVSNGIWKNYKAHRVSYTFFIGKIPDGLVMDHVCRNRKCCNPGHLRIVEAIENVLQNSVGICAKNIRKTHCKHGHEFTPENTRPKKEKTKFMSRECIACQTRRNKMRYLK